MKKFFVLMFLGLGLFFQSSHAVYQIGTEDWIPVAEEMSREDAKLHQAAMVI